MNWRDLLYFSKGERRALTLLLCLVTISWILLLWTDTKRMPIESQTDAHRTENQQASGERRIITGKNTSKKETSSIRKESVPHPNKTKNALTDKNAILIDNAPYSTSKKRKGYTPYTQTEKYAPGTLVELNTADTTILKKVPGIGSTFARRIIKYRELLGGFYDVSQLAEVYDIRTPWICPGSWVCPPWIFPLSRQSSSTWRTSAIRWTGTMSPMRMPRPGSARRF